MEPETIKLAIILFVSIAFSVGGLLSLSTFRQTLRENSLFLGVMGVGLGIAGFVSAVTYAILA